MAEQDCHIYITELPFLGQNLTYPMNVLKRCHNNLAFQGYSSQKTDPISSPNALFTEITSRGRYHACPTAFYTFWSFGCYNAYPSKVGGCWKNYPSAKLNTSGFSTWLASCRLVNLLRNLSAYWGALMSRKTYQKLVRWNDFPSSTFGQSWW